MKKIQLLILSVCFTNYINAQSLYFPPLVGNTWDTIAPPSLNWCSSRIDSLYNYLQVKNTKSFIILKNGKIVLEKYFGTYTVDSLFYWASASKSLVSLITGIAQQKGFVNINNPVSQYIGTGWTSAPLNKENLITLKNLLQLTAGLDESPPPPCDHIDTAKACLVYMADAGTRWGYHTGAYRKLMDAVSAASATNYNLLTNNWVKTKIGMAGFWFDQVYYSKARDMARFGLLSLNKGIWAADTVLKDSLFFKDMVNTSQSLNQAYGYLWWLNGKTSFMPPQIQITIPGVLMSNAPNDMYCALGKDDQKIYVVPSQKLVVIRQGNSAGGFSLASSAFDNNLWDYINKLNCTTTSISNNNTKDDFTIYPNPTTGIINFSAGTNSIKHAFVTNVLGKNTTLSFDNTHIDCTHLSKGIYFLHVLLQNNQQIIKKVVIY